MPEPEDGESWRSILTGWDGDHQWVAATNVPVDTDKVPGACDRHTVHLKEGAYARILDVICETCRAPVHLGWGKQCPGDKAPWLTGGPSHRQAPVDDPTYQRPPMTERELPAMPREAIIRNTLRQADRRFAVTSGQQAGAPILLPQRRANVMTSPRHGVVLAMPCRPRRPKHTQPEGQLMLLPVVEVG